MTHLAASGSVVLVSCYELGHAPHSLAVLSGFLAEAGFDADIVDLQVERLAADRVTDAKLVAVSVPMHTALRLATAAIPAIRELNPNCHICVFGLYAPLNAELLRSLGAQTIVGGECEAAIAQLAATLDRAGAAPGSTATHIERLRFPKPVRDKIRGASHYAHFIAADGSERLAGYTEATRGCLDTCRHCPVPAVYGGRFFVVPADAVLADIDAQVADGIEHITFGDPDFLNGPTHGMRVARELARRHPNVSFDITAQIAHLLAHQDAIAELAELGCAFVVSAAESLSDEVLSRLRKQHRRGDFERALELCESVGLAMRPTFVTFTPWTTRSDMVELVDFIAERDLIDNVAPIQLAVRLLVPPGSLLLSAPDASESFGPLDPEALTHTWAHPDPEMDELCRRIAGLVETAADRGESDAVTFDAIRAEVYAAAGAPAPETLAPRPRRRIPKLSEPWFC